MNLLKRKTHEMDMTQGSVLGNIVRFALPLLLGNLFQQLYNMVDTWVIGQTGEDGAYAAVGSVGPIINTLIGFFTGLATGAGVVISQYFGAKNEEKVQKAVHSSIIMTLILGVIFTIVGILLTPWILSVMLSSDGDLGAVYPYAKTYLTIYFSGVLGMMLYNMGAGILRAVGDSDRPFYYLVVTAVINTGLDLLFVFKFEMGVAGVAYATIIAQWVSAILVIITLMTSKGWVRLQISKLKLDMEVFKKILQVGLPSAIQISITAFSNIFVQSYIGHVNGDQTYALAGWTSYGKIDQIMFLPLQSLALAVSTFVGQNLGIGNVERSKKGTMQTYYLASGITVFLIAVIMIFARPLAQFFNASEPVVENAVMLLRYLSPFYIFCAVNQIFSGALRGSGDAKAPMINMLTAFVAFRQLYLYLFSNYISNDLIPIGMGYPAGWILCAILTFTYYKTHPIKAGTLIEVKQE